MRGRAATIGRRAALLGALAFFFGGVLSPQASAAFKHLQEGMTVQEIEGKDVRTGEKVTSRMDDAGEDAVLVITFWATWSQRSLEVLEDLKGMAGEYADRPFRVIAVNVEGEEVVGTARDAIEQTVRELDLPYPVILDEDLETFYAYGVVAVPSTAVVDAEGVLRYGPAGYSYLIRDRLVDSTQVLLGLKEPTEALDFERGYVPAKKASRYYNLALKLFRKGHHERALSQLEESSSADSLFSAPSNLRGQILLALGRPEEAAAEFEHAVALDDQSVAAWAGWGRALRYAGRDDAAREKLRAALALDEAYTDAMLDLAACLLAAGEVEAGLGLLADARELNPREPATYLILGQHQESEGQTAEALDTYRTALEILHPAP